MTISRTLSGERSWPPDGVAAGDAAEHPALLDAGRVQPGADVGHRAVRRDRVGGDMDEAALADLIGLGAGQKDAEPVRPEAQVADPDFHQLGAAEGTGEAEQDERPVALTAQIPATYPRDPDDFSGQ